MYRSASSTTRASDEFLVNLSPAGKGSPSLKTDDLPMYIPISDTTKKEVAPHHKSSAQNAIHIIPLILILSALILWFFSHTPKLWENIGCNSWCGGINKKNEAPIRLTKCSECTCMPRKGEEVQNYHTRAWSEPFDFIISSVDSRILRSLELEWIPSAIRKFQVLLKMT